MAFGKKTKLETLDLRIEDPNTNSASNSDASRMVHDDDVQATKKVVIDQNWNQTQYHLKVIPQPEETYLDPELAAGSSRRRSLFVMVGGMCIGVAIAFVILAKTNLPQIPGPQAFTPVVETVAAAAVKQALPSAEIQTAVIDTAPAIEPAQQVAVEQASLTNVIPAETTAIDHALNSAVNPEARKFIYLSGSERSYSPVLIPPADAKVGAKSSNVNLRQIPGKETRFANDGSSLEWQGGWSLNNPQKNVQLGSAYDQYLKDNVGSSFSSKLIGVEKGESGGLLRKIVSGGK